jgi:acetyl esterase/lipase
MWHKDEIYEAVKMPYGYNKPNGVMLIYPVITGLGRTHKGSFINLLMTENPTEEQLKAVSIENNVDEKSSPMFIMHTSNDDLVNVRNSLVLAEALAKQDIKFELHIYPDAPHGIALGNKITSGNYDRHENVAISKWIDNAAVWADGLE